ncbi:hypothetical protein [Sinomonas mesophila]|uniref:hypothetical protein n=1 Tax=Sinomonas mesophila TaxID=1531955 RepID=UPI000985C8F4|nr:hypothetical protein [Sinomonas mesophila]
MEHGRFASPPSAPGPRHQRAAEQETHRVHEVRRPQSADHPTARDRFVDYQERQRRTLLSAGLSDEQARAEMTRLAAGEVWGG